MAAVRNAYSKTSLLVIRQVFRVYMVGLCLSAVQLNIFLSCNNCTKVKRMCVNKFPKNNVNGQESSQHIFSPSSGYFVDGPMSEF